MKDVVALYRRYFDFRGRSDRREFFLGMAAFAVLFFAASFADSVLVGGWAGEGGPLMISGLGWLVFLGTLIPATAASFRRLHDSGWSAWWLLVAIVPGVGWLILLWRYLSPGEPEANRFGPPPRSPSSP